MIWIRRMPETPLYESQSAQAGADGKARVNMGPLRSFERWAVRSTTVASTSSVLAPECRLYRGGESPSNLFEGTFSGNLDTTDTAYTLRSGEKMLAVFSGCDVGSTCTVTMQGDAVR